MASAPHEQEHPPAVLRVAVCAGELSGDEHGAALVRALKRRLPQADVRGMGGRNLRAEDVTTVVDSEKSASAMGFMELFGSLGKVLSALSAMKKFLREWKPQVLIVIDFPDFNIRLAKEAARLGIPVLYFITPKVWAWRAKRIEVLKKVTKASAVIFPFEEKFFQDRGYGEAFFVGHPYVDSPRFDPPTPDERRAFKTKLGLDPAKPLLSVFPGSRRAELKRHLLPCRDAVQLLHSRHAEVQCVVCVAPTMNAEEIQRAFEGVPVTIYSGDSVELMRMSDAGLLKSGTSNLQAAFCDLPFTMFYVASPVSEAIVKYLVKRREFSLVNIIRPGSIREFLQKEVRPETLVREMEKLLYDAEYRAKMRSNLSEVRGMLRREGQGDAYANAVDVLVGKVLARGGGMY